MVDYSDIYGTGVDASSKHSFSKEPKRARSPYPPSAAVVGSSSVQHDFERHVVWISVYYLGRIFIYIYRILTHFCVLIQLQRNASKSKTVGPLQF